MEAEAGVVSLLWSSTSILAMSKRAKFYGIRATAYRDVLSMLDQVYLLTDDEEIKWLLVSILDLLVEDAVERAEKRKLK